MALIEAIHKRYSCRSYQDRDIEEEKLNEIIESVRLAPSAKNLQDWRFVFVTDKVKKNQLAQAANNQMFLAKAGVIVVGCSICDETMRCGQRVAPIDLAIGLEHIALQAAELGLQTCWIGSFYPEKVRPIFGIPENVEIIELMSIGYPADSFKKPSRVEKNNIVCYNQWSF